MSCESVPFAGGTAIICTRGAKPKPASSNVCYVCKKKAMYACDFQVARITPGGITCDRGLCLDHAHKVGRNKDLCPEHIEEYRKNAQ